MTPVGWVSIVHGRQEKEKENARLCVTYLWGK